MTTPNNQDRLLSDEELEARIDELRNTVLRDDEIYCRGGDGKFIPIQERFSQLRDEQRARIK